jgi:hypothetical protein
VIIYHGSSTLADAEIPRGSPPGGAFFTPDVELAKIFGRRIHCFEISGGVILDFRRADHLELAADPIFKTLLDKIELSDCSGLPLAFNHAVSVESLAAVGELALKLGFSGAYFHETSKHTGIEIWDTSVLRWVKSEPNADFDSLNA